MLDALLAEARVRWGLDPAAGVQVIAIEHLIATPVDPTRAVLLVPLAVLAPPGPSGAAAAEQPADAAAVAPLPGRHGPRGFDPLVLLRRLYPGDHPIGRFGMTDGTTVGAPAASVPGGARYLAAS